MTFRCLYDYDLSVISGDTFDLGLSFKDSFKEPILLDGASGRMMLRPTPLSSVVITMVGVIVDNTITFSMTKEETASLIGSKTLQQHFVYDVEITLASGEVQTVMNGQITINKDITRG